MKISFYLSVFFMALVIKIVTANVRVQRSPQQYCGSRLADIMKAICKSKYNEQIKRSKMDSEIWDYKELEDYKDPEDYNTIEYPYRSKREALSFTRFLRSTKPRIIDECCFKPCLISELRSYCAN